MTKDDLLHKPCNGMIDLAIQKQKEREELQRDIDAYLAKGGKIKVLNNGETADYNPIRKEKYDNSLRAHNLCGLKRL